MKFYNYIFLTIFLFFNYHKPLEKEIEIHTDITEKTLHTDIIEISYKYRNELPVRPDVFALWAYEVYLTESNIDTLDSKGINQMVSSTRKARNLPKHYNKTSYRYQIEESFKFWIDGGILKKCKSAEDLHVINMCPSSLRFKWDLTDGNKSNDINNDGFITDEDIRLYHRKKLKE